jgi:hypothetical protein
VIVIDTGPVVAAANRKDDYHEQCVGLLQVFPGPLLLPAPLITEIGYMLHSRAGSKAYAPVALCDLGTLGLRFELYPAGSNCAGRVLWASR